MSIEKLINMKDAPTVYLYSTGAGAGIQKKIWEIPGCSSFLIGCSFPYDTDETSRILGCRPEKFVSEDMAMELAMAAYQKAARPGRPAVGIGLTASVASNREHHGDHRIIVSSFSDTECLTHSMTIPKAAGFHQRMIDGQLADNLGLAAMFRAVGLPVEPIYYRDKPLLSNCNTKMNYEPVDTTERARALILAHPFFAADGSRYSLDWVKENYHDFLFCPGSFNPLHFGHVKGFEASRRTAATHLQAARDLVYNTTINPPHKAALTPAHMLNRVSQMRGKNFLLSQDDPLFVDKAKRYPGAIFTLGADTLLTMLDPKWGVPTAEVLKQLNNYDANIMVLGRLFNGEFVTLTDVINRVPLLKVYPHTFVEVPGRWDISSTEIRQRAK